MRILIRKIYFLLSYAWNVLREAEIEDISKETIRSSTDLLAKVLDNALSHILRRGLDRYFGPTRQDRHIRNDRSQSEDECKDQMRCQ